MKTTKTILTLIAIFLLQFGYGQEIKLTISSMHTDGIMDMKYSPDGKNIVTASSDKTARIWDSQTGKLIQKIESMSPLCFTPDNTEILIYQNNSNDSTDNYFSVKNIIFKQKRYEKFT